MKGLKKGFKRSIFFVFLLFALSLIVYLEDALRAVDSRGEGVRFAVSSGESLYSVLERLEQEGLIKDALPYKLYARMRKKISVKKGIYNLKPSQKGFEILKILEEGRQDLVKVTIPEGLTAKETARILEEEGILRAQDFLDLLTDSALLDSLGIAGKSAEGYLFPDTYYFQQDFPAEQVLSFMVKTCFQTVEELFPFYRDLGREKLQEKIILASIVEKEYRIPSEAPLIASVFYNRLRIGMPLQSCATIVYIITEELGRPHPRRLYYKDLELPSPTNTYQNAGLPEQPISNPGRTALNAVFNPAQSSYLYFVVKDRSAGTHNFTSTLTDHNRARADYLNGFRSK